ncbi:MAG: HEAT repeat domain-containing protein [Deltaproteobacteria bacterium]|nr:HEAT repeat domain-containing protein [Deltaproteobacteria bacterium]
MNTTLERLFAQTTSESDDVRFSAWMQIYQSDDPKAKAFLEQVASSGQISQKVLFCKFLGFLEDEYSARILVDLICDTEPLVVHQAILAFDKNNFQRRVYFLLPVLKAPLKEAQVFAVNKFCLESVSEAVHPVLDMLKQADEDLILEILSGLRFLADKRLFQDLKIYLGHPNERIRWRAIMIYGSLYETGVTRARRLLVRRLSDRSAQIRRSIIWTLRRNDDRRNLRLFLKLAEQDPDPTVRQEALTALGRFPSKTVIKNLVKLLVKEKNRMVVLKGEAVLLSIPTKQLIIGLKNLLTYHDKFVRNKVMIMYAEFQKTSETFFAFLIKELKKTKSDMDKIPIIESLGLLGNKAAIPQLEKLLAESPLLSYTSMMALLKIYGFDKSFPFLKYSQEVKLSALVRQIVMKHFIKISDDSMYNDEIVTHCMSLLSNTNLNIRYLATQILSKVQDPKVLVPFFKSFVNEDDPTAFRLLKENIHRLVQSNPKLFEVLLQNFYDHDIGVLQIFLIMKEANLNKNALLQIIKSCLSLPLLILNKTCAPSFIELVFTYVLKERISITDIIALQCEPGQKQQLLKGLLGHIKRYKRKKVVIGEHHVETWYSDQDEPEQKQIIIELISHTTGIESIRFLIDLYYKENNQPLKQSIRDSLNLLLEPTHD